MRSCSNLRSPVFLERIHFGFPNRWAPAFIFRDFPNVYDLNLTTRTQIYLQR